VCFQERSQLLTRSISVVGLDGVTDVHLILEQTFSGRTFVRQIRHGAHNEETRPGNVIFPEFTHGVVESGRFRRTLRGY
jgi:hypothetical protein